MTLTLTDAAANGDHVYVSYLPRNTSKPVLQDRVGNKVAIFAPRRVANNTPVTSSDTTAPTLSSAMVDGPTMTLTFSEALDTFSVPPTSAFEVKVATVTRNVTAVYLSGNTAKLTLASAVTAGQAVTVAYTRAYNEIDLTIDPDEPRIKRENRPGLRDVAGNPVANWTADAANAAVLNVQSLSLVVSETSLTLNESGSGNTDTFTVKLSNQPSSDVTIGVGVLASDWKPVEGGKRIATADKNILTFTSTTWNTAQTVTITGVEDKDDGDDTGRVRLIASQDYGPFGGVSAEIPLTVTDTSGRPGIEVAPEVLTIAEGSSGTYSVSLTSEPTGPVTVWMERSDAVPLTPSPAALTFTKTNYATAQTLTLHAGENTTGAERLLVQFEAAGGGYDGVRTELLRRAGERGHQQQAHRGVAERESTAPGDGGLDGPAGEGAALGPADGERDRVGGE